MGTGKAAARQALKAWSRRLREGVIDDSTNRDLLHQPVPDWAWRVDEIPPDLKAAIDAELRRLEAEAAEEAAAGAGATA